MHPLELRSEFSTLRSSSAFVVFKPALLNIKGRISCLYFFTSCSFVWHFLSRCLNKSTTVLTITDGNTIPVTWRRFTCITMPERMPHATESLWQYRNRSIQTEPDRIVFCLKGSETWPPKKTSPVLDPFQFRNGPMSTEGRFDPVRLEPGPLKQSLIYKL